MPIWNSSGSQLPMRTLSSFSVADTTAIGMRFAIVTQKVFDLDGTVYGQVSFRRAGLHIGTRLLSLRVRQFRRRRALWWGRTVGY